VHLVTYFGVPSLEILNLLPRDLTLGVEAISLEKSMEIFDKLKDYSSIRLGIVDSRNTKMEKIDDLISLVFKLEDKGIHIEYLSFNTMAEFLPEVVAYKKVKLLKRVVEAIKH
jgi:5-methyltetrahydropteroyltriglutamate--homocysteine methyltransferase